MNLFFRLAFVIVASAILCVPAHGQNLQWKSFQNQADEAVNHHDDAAAAKLYQLALAEATKTHDESAQLQTLIKVGDCKQRMGDNNGAVASYKQSLPIAEKLLGADSEQTSYVLIRLGRAELKQHKLADAEHHLKRALKIENEHPNTARGNLMRGLAELNFAQGKLEEGRALLSDSVSLQPGAGPEVQRIHMSPSVARRVEAMERAEGAAPALSDTSSANAPKPGAETSQSTMSHTRSAQLGSATQAELSPFAPYLADVQRRVRKHWFPPKGNESKRVVVAFSVDKMGSALNCRLKQSCGVALADNAALKAILDASPFRPLPAEEPETVPIEFTFSYDVLTGHGTAVRVGP